MRMVLRRGHAARLAARAVVSASQAHARWAPEGWSRDYQRLFAHVPPRVRDVPSPSEDHGSSPKAAAQPGKGSVSPRTAGARSRMKSDRAQRLVSPLEAKLICVEAGKARDRSIERFPLRRRRRWRDGCLASAARFSPLHHHAARRVRRLAARLGRSGGALQVGDASSVRFGAIVAQSPSARSDRPILAPCRSDRSRRRSRACAGR